MTADWFLFWQQHYEHAEISEFELEIGMLNYGFQVIGRTLGTQLVPAFRDMAASMTRFLLLQPTKQAA